MKTPAADQWVAEGEIPSLFSCFAFDSCCLGETRPALLCSAGAAKTKWVFCGGSSGAVDVWRFDRAKADSKK